MKITEANRKLIIGKLESIWKEKRDCNICFNPTTWSIGSVVEVKEFNEGNHCPGAAITPLVQVTCDTCGNTVFFNAIVLGVVDRDTAKLKELEP